MSDKLEREMQSTFAKLQEHSDDLRRVMQEAPDTKDLNTQLLILNESLVQLVAEIAVCYQNGTLDTKQLEKGVKEIAGELKDMKFKLDRR